MSAPPFLGFAAPDFGQDEIAEVGASLRSGWLGTGPRVARFEADLAHYRGLPPAGVRRVSTAAQTRRPT